MKIACIGYGNIGGALAEGFSRLGHEVVLVERNAGSARLSQALGRDPGLRAQAPEIALEGADVVVLAIPFKSCEDVLPGLADMLSGKILVDCTNPVGPGMSHGLSSAQAGAELVQGLVPGAKVVKAFNVYGFENLPRAEYPYPGIRAAMPIAGDDSGAKRTVCDLAEGLGWEPLDVGDLSQALHLEHMTLLWVKMVRMGGRSPRLAWAKLTGDGI